MFKKLALFSLYLIGILSLLAIHKVPSGAQTTMVSASGASNLLYGKLFACGPDCALTITSSGGTATSASFAHTFASAPSCFAEPQFDVGSGVRSWVTTTTTAVTVNTSGATTGAWFVFCPGF